MKPKEVAVLVAIAVLSALFIGLLVDAIYEAPEYDDFCKKSRFAPQPIGKDIDCEYELTREERDLVDTCYDEDGTPRYNYDENGCQTTFKECDFCSKEFKEANSIYNRNLFFIIAPIALVFIIGGLYVGFEVVGTGFMFSGILLLIYATMRYFSDMSKILRVIVIGIELVLVLVIAMKKLKK